LVPCSNEVTCCALVFITKVDLANSNITVEQGSAAGGAKELRDENFTIFALHSLLLE
jgi:hypothetical protein